MRLRNKEILRLALPSIISNITVPLLGLVDLTIVGHMDSVAYIGAISVGTMIFNVIYWIFGFLRMGTSGMTSQALGRRDLAEVMKMFVRSLLVGLATALVFIVFQSPVRSIVLGVMHPSAQIMPHARTYFNICIWGAPAMLSLYGLTGWFIGMQNTRIPMIVSIFQNVVNILASLLFVYAFRMKIEGVATGTLVAQWSGFLLSFLLWHKYYGKLKHQNWRQSLFLPEAMKKFFTVNRDIFLRTLFLVSVNLFFVSAGARQGDVILSVNTLLMTLFTIFSYFMDGFAYAGEAMGGKAFGSRNARAFDEICRGLFFWGAVMVVVFTLIYVVGGKGFLSLLTSQQSVVDATEEYLWWAALIPLTGVMAFIFDGVFIGMTATSAMLRASVMAALLFFGIFPLFRPYMHNHALWLAFIVYLATRSVSEWIFFVRLRRKSFA